MQRSHDLNARAWEIARERGCTFAQARAELARRGGVARARNRSAFRSAQQRSQAARAREERMGLA